MSSWRIREIENEIRDLESKQRDCSYRDDEWYELEKKIDDLKDELRRLKRREQEEEENRRRSSAFSIGTGSIGMHHNSGFGGGGFGGFGGGGFGGGGSGGSW